jgi:hypothetical protein
MPWKRSAIKLLDFAFMVMTGILLVSAQLTAQRVKSSLSGIVSDPSGAVVPGATVVLTNAATGVSMKFVTNVDGTYRFPFLDAGNYTLNVTASGFKALIRTGIIVRVATDERMDVKLELGQVSQQVSVAGQSPLLETVSSTLGQTINNRYISNVPLNGRDPFS